MYPILFRAGHYQVTSYVALIALAGVCSLLYFWRFRRALGLPDDDAFWFLANVLGISGVIGGRLLDLLLHPRTYAGAGDFLTALTTNKDGFSTFGVLGGVLLGVWFAGRRLHMDYLRTLDYVCLVIPVGHGIARIGCFLNGCCHGCVPHGDLPWAVVFSDSTSAVHSDLLGQPLHPTQLYEATGDWLIAGLLFFLVRPRVECGVLPRGLMAAGYFLGYGLIRFLTEFFLGNPESGKVTGLTLGQIFSLVIITLAAILLRVAITHQRSSSSRAAH
jgi:phosphatidylglycerol:prolipoprotein diacylglycerol transferase